MTYVTAWPVKRAKTAVVRATFYIGENQHRMQTMIIEDDAWIADLLKQIVLKIRPHAQVRCFDRVAGSALRADHQRLEPAWGKRHHSARRSSQAGQ